MATVDLVALRAVALLEFGDIVVTATIIDAKLRVILDDSSYVDFWWSRVLPGRFAHHWERSHVDGSIYRHDNAPHAKWAALKTFPQHFHCGRDAQVEESRLSERPEAAVREFLAFARSILRRDSTEGTVTSPHV